MVSANEWRSHAIAGSAGDLHARDLLAESVIDGVVANTMWWCQPDGPAVVVGSAQARRAGDAPLLGPIDAEGRPIVRRRSGGGAVLVGADEGVWIDVVLRRDDPRWNDDVSHSADWLGRVWAAVLMELGVHGAVVWGGPVEGSWAPQICFAGRAGGEVVVDGRKVVGISQRRTRLGARFQTHVLQRWRPGPLLAVAVVEAERTAAAAEVADRAIGLTDLGLDVSAETIAATLFRHLT